MLVQPLTSNVSAPPTILRPRPVDPLGISIRHSWPGIIGAVLGFGDEGVDDRPETTTTTTTTTMSNAQQTKIRMRIKLEYYYLNKLSS